jgi:hypothetical protein
MCTSTTTWRISTNVNVDLDVLVVEAVNVDGFSNQKRQQALPKMSNFCRLTGKAGGSPSRLEDTDRALLTQIGRNLKVGRLIRKAL